MAPRMSGKRSLSASFTADEQAPIDGSLPDSKNHIPKRRRVNFTPESFTSAITTETHAIQLPEAGARERVSPQHEVVADSSPIRKSAGGTGYAPDLLFPSSENCELRGASPTSVADDVAVEASFISDEEDASGAWSEDTLVKLLTRDLDDLCEANEGYDTPSMEVSHATRSKLKMFYSAYRQPFELEYYVRRLVQFMHCSPSAFVVAMIYLDRLQQNTLGLRLSHMNCHRLLLTAVCLATKYLDDEIYSNAYYARVGGMSVAEMNRLEATMLGLLDWNLNVSPEMFSLFEDSLLNAASVPDSDGELDAAYSDDSSNEGSYVSDGAEFVVSSETGSMVSNDLRTANH